MHLVLILLNYLLFPAPLYSEPHPPLTPRLLTYDVYKGQSLVGEMTVSRREEGSRQIYESESQMTVSFLMSFDLKFTYKATFESSNLQTSHTANFRDGKQINLSSGRRVGNTYSTEVNGEPKNIQAPKIDYSILNTYFIEPVGRTKVFSERWGDYVDFLPAGKSRYGMHLPNGDVNYMTYKEGVCQTIEVNHSLASIRFVLREKQ
ncbi:MAG: DUF6134 family protein [Bacteroidia bacterium]